MSVTEDVSTVSNNSTEELHHQAKEGDEHVKGISLAVSIGGGASNDGDGSSTVTASSSGGVCSSTSTVVTTTLSISATVAAATSAAALADPAILAVREIKFRYDKEELLKLRDVPLSQRKPDFFDINDVSPSIWDPNRWNFERKKSDTPTEGAGNVRPGDMPPDHRNMQRRSGDPRERIRKENDGIVLSPQRRSFNSGCFVPVRETTSRTSNSNRPHSPLGGKSESSHMGGVREISSTTGGGGGNTNRRIGSGRILRDTWDFGGVDSKPVDNMIEIEYDGYHPSNNVGGGGGGSLMGRNHQRSVPTDSSSQQIRRTFGRNGGGDFDKDGGLGGMMNKDRRNGSNSGGPGSGGGGGRYGNNDRGDNRRRMNDMGMSSSHAKEYEEPEWFSGGPMSQNDTIELRGFDESDRLGGLGVGKKKMSPSQAKRARDWFRKKTEVSEQQQKQDDNNAMEDEAPPPGGRSTPTPQTTANEEAAAAQTTTSIGTSEDDQQSKNRNSIHSDNDINNTDGDDMRGSTAAASGGQKKSGMENGLQNMAAEQHEGGSSSSSAGLGGDGVSNNKKRDEGDKTTANNINDHSSIFEDILKSDSIPGLPGFLTNGVGGEGDNHHAKSRFTKWFSIENTTSATTIGGGGGGNPMTNSRRSSSATMIQDDPIVLLKNLNETLVSIPPPGDAESYFAPISPAANTGGGGGGGAPHGMASHHLGGLGGNNHHGGAGLGGGGGGGGVMSQQNKGGINIMEMLQRNRQQQQQHQQQAAENNLLGGVSKTHVPGRIMNLVELEAKIRQHSVDPMMHKHAQKPEEEMAAFNRLLAQVSGGHAVTANGPLPQKAQPMSLMEMLTHSQQQDEAAQQAAAAAARMAHLLGPASPVAAPSQSQILPQDLAARLQQQQQHKQQVDMLTKLVNANMQLQQQQQQQHFNQQMRASPLPEMGVQQSRELLSRPEAQAILQGLKIGDITPQHLYQQLANPALQPRHREMLVTILKMQGGVVSGGGGGGGGVVGSGPSPRVLSPVPPPPAHALFQQQAQQQQQQQQQQQTVPPTQQLRVSPLPPNAYCVSPIMATSPNTLTVPAMHNRIPSPRELQVHTQNILQRALIKKKLEEQQENYRKKQEILQQRVQSPNNNNNMMLNSHQNNNSTAQQLPPTAKSVSSPTPLAFTPTSVLRKMTAEKDENGKDVSKLVDGKLNHQGRALTGMRQQTQQQQQQQQQPQPMGRWPFMNVKQPGRPIVKANNFQQQQPQQTPQEQYFNSQQQQQQKLFNALQPHHQPQQQQLSSQQQQQQLNNNNKVQQQQQHYHHHQQQQQQQQYSNGQQHQHQQPQLTQQQLRAQHQQHARPATAAVVTTASSTTASSTATTTSSATTTTTTTVNNSQQQQQMTGTANWQQFLNAHQRGVNNQQQLGNRDSAVGGSNGGDLSPTSNQLTRWFSPDLLERARIGELPSTAGLAQHAMSLEEIERLTAPPVHN